MDDVERVFTKLVDIISADDVSRLKRPLEVAEIYQTIVPYRQFKTELGFDSSQDYEMAILKLLAGEHGFATMDPPEVGQALADEAAAVNPNPGAFREYAAARVFLNVSAVDAHVTETPDVYAPPEIMETPPAPSVEASYAPTVEEPALPPTIDPSMAPTLPFTAVTDDIPPPERPSVPGITTFTDDITDSCPSCTRGLPRRSDLHFCPFCGMDVMTPSCRFCGADVDPNWTFCISCGRDKNADG